MHEAAHPKPVLWDNPEGVGEERGGRCVQDRDAHVYLWPIHNHLLNYGLAVLQQLQDLMQTRRFVGLLILGCLENPMDGGAW